MELEVLLDTPLRGDRDYITGADLCAAADRELVIAGAWLESLKFRRFAGNSCVLSTSERAHAPDSIVATGTAMVADRRRKVIVLETEQSPRNRIAFDERAIVELAQIDDSSISQVRRSGHSFIDECIALTKFLHQQVLGGEGKWIFTSIGLSAPMPSDERLLKISLTATIGGRATRAAVEVGGTPCAVVGFRLV